MRKLLQISLFALVFYFAFTSMSMSQNIIRNGSFENTTRSDFLLLFGTSTNYQNEDFVTCFLGEYDTTYYDTLSPIYPILTHRHETKNDTEKGCDGWYNPFYAIKSTPDYFHRNARIVLPPYSDVGVPRNDANDKGVNGTYVQEPFDDDRDGTIDEGDEDAYVGLLYSDSTYQDIVVDTYGEYISQRLQTSLEANNLYFVSFKVS